MTCWQGGWLQLLAGQGGSPMGCWVQPLAARAAREADPRWMMAALRGQDPIPGCDGWRCAEGHRVRLIDPEAHLRLIDDDKQSGVAQALLTDMFTRMQVRAPPPTSPRTVTAVRGGAGGAASHLPALAASELWPRSFVFQS